MSTVYEVFCTLRVCLKKKFLLKWGLQSSAGPALTVVHHLVLVVEYASVADVKLSIHIKEMRKDEKFPQP